MTIERDEFSSLVDAARRGEERSFTRLYDEFVDPLTGFVRARGVRDADEVVNEVFLAVFTGLDSFDGDQAGFRAWVFRIARNKVADWFRTASREDRRVAAVEAVTDPDPGRLGDRQTDELVQDMSVQSMLGHLTPDQRDVILLRVVADLSVPQTAEVLGKPVTAVKSLQVRALARLEQEISRQPRIDSRVSDR